jgi:hypothetical protein
MAAPYDKIIIIDFETKWNSKSGYTLSKMTTEEYIRDAQFKAYGACIKEYGDKCPATWHNGTQLHDALSMYDWSRTAILAHNAQFDVTILEWVYDIHPCFIFDTLSMARALRGVEVGNSLMKLAEAFGLPPKGNALYSTDGWEGPLTPVIEQELATYCQHDVFLCEEIFSRLVVGYPASELRLIDMTLRMYTQPCLQLDQLMLFNAITEEKKKREGLLERLGIAEESLASNPKFAQVLESLGVPAPYKTNRKGLPALALAKTDAMFQALLNGENEEVALLCEARLAVKSTTERTRAQRFLDIASRGSLPVPLSYYGASTGRYTASKGSAINMQNLKRGSFLRKAIMAPEGYQVCVADLSQIEPRVLAWLSDYTDMLDIFRAGGDPYATFGSRMFNIPGMTRESNPDLRQSAKSALLGCFGADTLVLTKRGWGTMLAVLPTDLLWDGQSWVPHQGVIAQGEKEVLTALGVSATSDHEILTVHGWEEWSEVLAKPSLLMSALSRGNLPVLDGSADLAVWNGEVRILTSLKCGEPLEKLLNYEKGLPFLKQKMQTYDIANAGPRNRYTILTDMGPLIVHNCGYQLGWASFASQLLVGFLGAPPVRYSKTFARALGVDAEYIENFLAYEPNVEKMREIPHICTEQELLIHCVAAKKIIDIYRATAHPVASFWEMCQGLIETSLYGGKEHVHKCLVFKKEEILLPNGMSLLYPDLRKEPEKKFDCTTQEWKATGRSQWVYGPDATKLYAGKITNNVTQAVARIVMTDGMLRVNKRYPICGTVHDDLITVVPDHEREEAYSWMIEQMTKEPKYMPGIPLAADGGVHRRYGMAKK